MDKFNLKDFVANRVSDDVWKAIRGVFLEYGFNDMDATVHAAGIFAQVNKVKTFNDMAGEFLATWMEENPGDVKALLKRRKEDS